MKSRDIRSNFIKYFEKNGHRQVASSSLIPENDATLLFANAGMNQFKNLFLGLETRDYTRAVTSQKCVRAGGKHNDLENVGVTARHHTFFEMLGNFSFGDYFKREALKFAWDLLTVEMQIPKDKLFVTVFTTDDEAADIWHKDLGVAKDRIYRFGEKDNFWRMGDVGPCGPCSEIFYDHGPDADEPGHPSVMGGDGDRYVEIWNNVFMQYNEDANGRHALPRPSVDTGGGLERWAAAMQGKPNNYDTDLFLPIISEAARISKKDYVSDRAVLRKHADVRESTTAMRVVADHSRAVSFLIADGVLPSNEGRGYVLRRMLRRAIRFARKLSDDPTLFEKTCAVVVSEMGVFFPELVAKRAHILATVHDEIVRFLTTLDQGTDILHTALSGLESRGQKTLDGATIFKLYDTFGFPADLTSLMAVEKGFAIDEAGFEKEMEAAKEKARASWKGKALSADAQHLVKVAQTAREAAASGSATGASTSAGGSGEGAKSQQTGTNVHATSVGAHGTVTKFTGYKSTRDVGQVKVLSNGHELVKELKAGDTGVVVFDQTPFYAESGGQAGDTGVITSLAGARAEVLDCQKQLDIHLHHVRVIEGTLRPGENMNLQVQESARRLTAANHSATHLLHAALRKVLGTHVTQAGSLVDPARLRFDFTHNKPLTAEESLQIEELVNAEISKSIPVAANEMNQKDAMASGAVALFGEKYGDVVRVIQMGDFSTELCGGTHVGNTSEIRLFKLLGESGVSSGVRRIEAATSDRALGFLMKNARENIQTRAALGLQEAATVSDWIETSRAQMKNLEKEIRGLKGSAVDVNGIFKSQKTFAAKALAGAELKLITAHLEMDDRTALAEIADRLKDKLGSGVVILVGKGDAGAASHPIIVTVSKDLTAKISAGKLLGEIAKELGGKGGGRPDFAQGAVPDLSRLASAWKVAESL